MATYNKIKPTTTIGYGGDNWQPTHTIAEGRLTPKQFSKAMEYEGWDKSDLPEVKYEFWRKGRGNYWSTSEITDLKARLVTVMEW